MQSTKVIKGGLLASALALTGCAEMPDFRNLGGGGAKFQAPSPDAPRASVDAELPGGERSAIIDSLIARRSVLEPGAMAQVSDAVMAANTRAAEADLRAAVLRSEATQKNWLPTLNPQVSLSHLGDLVTGLVVNQSLLDAGGRKSERIAARKDIEVAAVALAEDSNSRVLSALDLYLNAQAADAGAAVLSGGLKKMEHFEYIMRQRVEGGVSDRSELNVVRQRLSQLKSDLASDREAGARARAELAVMTAAPISGLSGLSGIGGVGDGVVPLAVLKAQAEADRDVALAEASRSRYLPSLSATGRLTSAGNSGSVNGGIQQGFGFGTSANLRALEAAKDAARARVGEVRETSARRLAALESQLRSLQRQQREAQGIAAQASANYDIFAAQLEGGQRTVPDVVGVFDTRLRTQRTARTLAYEIARTRLQIAALRGVLVPGNQI